MQFLENNYLDTLTMVSVESNTDSAAFIFNPNRKLQYVSSGYNNDLTTTTIQINFSETLTINRLAMDEMNFKDFTIYYNGATASQLSLTGGVPTSTSDFSSNSETGMFLHFDDINVTSFSIDVASTIVADAEKAIGYLYIGALIHEMSRPPASKNYRTHVIPKQIIHGLSDGAQRKHVVSRKWETKMKYSYLQRSEVETLENIFENYSDFFFAAFPTAASWDRILYKAMWANPFEFYEYSDDAPDVGFTGSIILRESN